MAKVWKKDHPIPWICDDEETAFYAATGDYRLKVELRAINNWFWSVQWKGKDIVSKKNGISQFLRSKSKAIGLAEGVYIGHQEAREENDFEIRLFRSAI